MQNDARNVLICIGQLGYLSVHSNIHREQLVMEYFDTDIYTCTGQLYRPVDNTNVLLTIVTVMWPSWSLNTLIPVLVSYLDQWTAQVYHCP